MLKLNITIRNPKAKDMPCQFNWHKTFALSQYKAFEIQVWHGSPYEICSLDIDLAWRGHDHAGPNLQLGILGYELILKTYDTRHWDYKNGTWETPKAKDTTNP
jgi:hypothetical protein